MEEWKRGRGDGDGDVLTDELEVYDSVYVS